MALFQHLLASNLCNAYVYTHKRPLRVKYYTICKVYNISQVIVWQLEVFLVTHCFSINFSKTRLMLCSRQLLTGTFTSWKWWHLTSFQLNKLLCKQRVNAITVDNKKLMSYEHFSTPDIIQNNLIFKDVPKSKGSSLKHWVCWSFIISGTSPLRGAPLLWICIWTWTIQIMSE